MKSAFSLLELIFAIVILGIIVAFAVPRFMDTKDSALVSTIKRDVNTAINSIQSYYLLNNKIDKISDAMNISDTNWNVEDLKISDKNGCLSMEVNKTKTPITMDLKVDTTKTSSICTKIRDGGLVSKSYEVY